MDQYNQIRNQTQQAQGVLKKKINDVPPPVFTGANAFLKQLQHAAKLTG